MLYCVWTSILNIGKEIQMKLNTLKTFLAISALLLSMLACTLGSPAPEASATQPAEAENVASTPESTTNTTVGACANPYLPVVVGATWNYKLTGSTTDTYTRSIIAADASSFTDQDVFGTGVTRQGKWNCENGNLTALNPTSGNSASVNTENVSVDFQTTEFSGVSLPGVINIGDTWTQTTTLEGTETINGTQMPAKNQFSNTCTAAGTESVTVEAGTFDALRVECQTVMNITITMNESPIETAVNLNTTNWYAEKIGLLKTVSTGEGFDSTTELTSYNIP